jgi:hypothetical protein
LPPLRDSTLGLGYVTDDTSYPGENVIYVVAYTAAGRTAGAAFAVFASERNGSLELSIQNNATFAVDKSEPTGVTFVNPPLGGAWTQEHLATAIRRVATQPIYRVPADKLRRGVARTVCSAYTDPQPTKSGGT